LGINPRRRDDRSRLVSPRPQRRAGSRVGLTGVTRARPRRVLAAPTSAVDRPASRHLRDEFSAIDDATGEGAPRAWAIVPRGPALCLRAAVPLALATVSSAARRASCRRIRHGLLDSAPPGQRWRGVHGRTSPYHGSPDTSGDTSRKPMPSMGFQAGMCSVSTGQRAWCIALVAGRKASGRVVRAGGSSHRRPGLESKKETAGPPQPLLGCTCDAGPRRRPSAFRRSVASEG
jgi:hypothetical protein